MKKLIFVLFIFFIGGVAMFNSKKNEINHQLHELVEDLEFDTKFNQKDFDYSTKVSRQYSDDVGMPEWIGL
ncbi:MAG: hypothetical protein KKH92_06090 [Firmicutes bacterium]|nr:hypothetical protein [Bacillota bacterium]